MRRKCTAKSRQLKVNECFQKTSSIFRDYKIIPKITLAGDWLLRAGFPIGSMTEVEIFKDQIVIRRIS